MTLISKIKNCFDLAVSFASFKDEIQWTERGCTFAFNGNIGDKLFFMPNYDLTLNVSTGTGSGFKFEAVPGTAEKSSNYRLSDHVVDRCLEKEKKILMNNGMEIYCVSDQR